MNVAEAWNQWRRFRSAQSEITTIYLIEKYFMGRVLEIIPEGKSPTPDLRIRLGNQDFLLEIKAQSGQQTGRKHPRAKKDDEEFDPQYESDLKSWLFEKKISSRNNKPMVPKTLEAAKKKADILVAMTDIFSGIEGIIQQISFIIPESEFIHEQTIDIKDGQILKAHFFRVDNLLREEQYDLNEIWLFDEGRLDRFIVISNKSMILLNHLRACHQQ
jgi:hypothetical protein